MTGRYLASLLALTFLAPAAAFGDVPQVAPKDKASPEKRDPAAQRKVKRVLLLGQSPDGHPWATHEYMAGMRILAQCLQGVGGLQTIIVNADEPWKDGPELIDGADGVVLFVSQGAKWVHQVPARLAALKRLAERGGGFVGWHWGIGCQEARYIDEYLKLLGGCHGGPDRKYKVLDATIEIADPRHPVVRGVRPVEVHEEFYYRLKFVKPADGLTPLIRAPIDGEKHTVAWAWERPDGGRSFGFSGGHFHRNLELEPYRRLMTQAVLWSLQLPAPEKGLSLKASEKDLRQPRPKPPGKANGKP
jgi:type 1 glutamine amidotransferase